MKSQRHLDTSGSDRSFRVAVLGTWNWLEVAAGLLHRAGVRCETVDLRSKQAIAQWFLGGHWRRFDAIHHVRGTYWALGTALAIVNKPIIWHWIGTDVLRFRSIRAANHSWRTALTLRSVDQWAHAHLADSPELAEELKELGVKTEVVRLLPQAVEAEPEPLPKQPCVLCYWSQEHREFHQAGEVMKLAQVFPDVRFLIAGDSGEGMESPPNVTFVGRLPDLAHIYSQTSILLRLVVHDSISAMVLEDMARGRYVIYSQDFPFTQKATNFDQARNALRKLIPLREINAAGVQYVRSHFSISQQAEKLRSIYHRKFKAMR